MKQLLEAFLKAPIAAQIFIALLALWIFLKFIQWGILILIIGAVASVGYFAFVKYLKDRNRYF